MKRKDRKHAVTESASQSPVTSAQIVEALFAIPEIAGELQQESFTRADIELALDDRGWLTPNARTFQELDPATRNIKIAQSRMYWQADPLAKQAVRLWTDYALGNGMSYHSDDAGTQKQLDQFMKNRRNRRLTSSKGQRRSSNKLLIDGDLFFTFFESKGNTDIKLMRYLDPLQVHDIITSADDEECILGYKRKDARGKVFYYQDWAADQAELDDAQDPQEKKSITWEQNIVVYHLAFDDLGKRGNGLLTACLGWTREHRRFMEARVAITQALAKFAWKLTTKGGQNVVNAVQKKLQSSLSTTGFTGAPEKNPPPAPAATYVGNQGADMVPMPRATGAGDSKEDSNQLKLMVCAATGIMLHYFGDPSTGNLATATAMELPMLKMFQAYQQVWQDAYRDIFCIALGEDPDEEPAQITIDMPPILSDDVGELGDLISKVVPLFPEMKVEQVVRLILNALKVPDVSEVMTAVEDKRKELDAQPKPQPAVNPQAVQALNGIKEALEGLDGDESQQNFTEAIEQIAAKLSDPRPHIVNKRKGKIFRELSGEIRFEEEVVAN
jgi:hypothetical protein